MVFYWQGRDEQSRLLVWGSTQYHWGGTAFGLMSGMTCTPNDLENVAIRTARQLGKLEKRYPYDIWLLASYMDDEEPNLSLNQVIKKWNQTWKWPQLRTVGNLDEPFDRLRQNFDAHIPVLSGDITGGWYQLPLTTPELLAQKFAVDRLLPTAEKLATLAGLLVPGYAYPATSFNRAWDALLCNDEHSYGVSGYQGQRVYETWMQHRDWIDKAEQVAEQECDRALDELTSQISAPEPSLVLFNPTLQERRELICLDTEQEQTVKFVSPAVPPFGYAVVPLSELEDPTEPVVETPDAAPTIENQYYRVSFCSDGSIAAIFDKDLKRELLDPDAPFRGNQFVYTTDNHQTFSTPPDAHFQIERDPFTVTVVATMDDPVSGAALEQRVSLPGHEKRIDIVNRLSHVTDLINSNRYYRYGYYAFPFAIENATPQVQLNGCVATPGKDQTGHGTETYMAAREWCCVQNDSIGVALLQLDSQLVEFDRIHPDKTDCFLNDNGSAVYSYLFNDWLQMHTPGGSHVNPQFRYTIMSYTCDFRNAGAPQLAERLAHPVMARHVPAQQGPLPATGMSFIEADCDNLRLLALKRAEDGNGIIARFQENHDQTISRAAIQQSLVDDGNVTRCTVDERGNSEASGKEGFSVNRGGTLTLRIEGRNIPEETALPPPAAAETPAPIGSVYTGIIDQPRAVFGEYQGHLYLVWGQNQEADLSHYELFRSEESGFTPDTATFLAKVEPGPYRVARYEDRDLRTHREYFYRVRAIAVSGRTGEFSREFCGLTRE
jgi:hypothetical protein